jgi:hypothetical protein
VHLSRQLSPSFIAHLEQVRKRQLDSLRRLRDRWGCATNAEYLDDERATWVNELMSGSTRTILQKRGTPVPLNSAAAAAALSSVTDQSICRAAGNALDKLDGIASTSFAVFY